MMRLEAVLVAVALAAAPLCARSMDDDPTATPPAAEPAPTAAPPALPADVPAPPAETTAQAATPTGQWVYTSQYGWVWMPYGDAYDYVPPNGEGEPYEYVFYPDYGWTWVVAPWVWGIGPWPYFGVFGPGHFRWYAHGWWRSPGRWHFRPGPFRGGVAFHGVRPAPARGTFFARGAAGGRPFGFVGHPGGGAHFAGGHFGGGGHFAGGHFGGGGHR